MTQLLFGSTTFMIAGVRFFKYFAVHPRLGEISETIAISATPIGHFALVFVTLLFVFAYVGHFLFAFAMPEEFGTVWDSVQATIKMHEDHKASKWVLAGAALLMTAE